MKSEQTVPEYAKTYDTVNLGQYHLFDSAQNYGVYVILDCGRELHWFSIGIKVVAIKDKPHRMKVATLFISLP